jgi:prolipoprotein diacylglyceryltransferase
MTMANPSRLLAFLPSPPANGIRLGPLFIHVYGLMYVIGIILAIYITARRWAEAGGDRSLVYDVALWAVPAGIIGGRIYFDITTPFDMPHHWGGPFAVRDGGLGIWGGVALAVLVGAWRVRRDGWHLGCRAHPRTRSRTRPGSCRIWQRRVTDGCSAIAGAWNAISVPAASSRLAAEAIHRLRPPTCYYVV